MIQLAEPFRTPYDFRFSVFGFPIRIQVLFWLTAAILGYTYADSVAKGDALVQGQRVAIDPALVFLVMVANFISILIHELGHSFMMRRFGLDSHIVLYWFGGIAIGGEERGEDSPWGSMSWKPERRVETTAGQRILIAFAGPLAGFILAAVIVLLIVLSGGKFWFVAKFPAFFDFDFAKVDASNRHLLHLTHVALYFNIYWGLMNLLPVFPLDGGQISREIFVQKNPWQGMRMSLLVSLWTSAGVALVGLVIGELFLVLFFASLAATSWQALQQIQSHGDRW